LALTVIGAIFTIDK